MRAYIAISYTNRMGFDKELNTIQASLQNLNIIPFIFVDQYQFNVSQEREMMLQAMSDIDHSDLLIAETSIKTMGIGIEIGYARAKGKPIIYLRHADASHSTTASGISDVQIIYHDLEELHTLLASALQKLRNTSLIP